MWGTVTRGETVSGLSQYDGRVVSLVKEQVLPITYQFQRLDHGLAHRSRSRNLSGIPWARRIRIDNILPKHKAHNRLGSRRPRSIGSTVPDTVPVLNVS